MVSESPNTTTPRPPPTAAPVARVSAPGGTSPAMGGRTGTSPLVATPVVVDASRIGGAAPGPLGADVGTGVTVVETRGRVDRGLAGERGVADDTRCTKIDAVAVFPHTRRPPTRRG